MLQEPGHRRMTPEPGRSPAPATTCQDPLAPSPWTWTAALLATALAVLATLATPRWHGPVADRFVLVFPRSHDPAALCEFSSRGFHCHGISGTHAKPGGF